MYVDDAVEAIHRIVGGDRRNTIVNLAAGNPISIEQLVRESAAALGIADVDIRKEGTAHESNHFQASTREMTEWYGFTPTVDLATGMRRFRDFCLGNTKGVVTHV
jgi:nucleoside-diphosphate-sugar epimerase